jgi:Domain of unknown function (DUF1707)
MNNDRMRVSDADRERVAARLREHYAEGRLSSDELDERISAALSAKTNADLRHVMADLPEPAPEPSYTQQAQAWGRRPTVVYRRRPRIWPIAVFALFAALVLPGAGWLFLAFFKIVLLFWLVACVAGIIAMARFRRRMHRHGESGDGPRWHHYQWHG